MSRSTRIWFIAGACVWALLFAAAVAAVAAYYEPANGLHYSSRIGFAVVAAGFSSSKEALGRAFTYREWLLTICVVAGLLTFVLTWNTEKSAIRFGVFAAQFLLPWGWLGILMLPYAILQGVDGEWLAEHSPTMLAAGLWLCYAFAMAVASWDRAWIIRHSNPTTEKSG